MKLIITEKPSVATEFAKALKINSSRKNGYIESSDWIITWCYGHLITMSYPEVYDEKLKYWNLNTLPFLPKEYKYEVISGGIQEKQFSIVRQLLQREDIEVIYNAGDSGREGEYIQRLVFMMAKPNPNAEMKRVWIDSQTEDEIRRGIKEAKNLSEYDSLSDSAYLRAKEDYLIGINFSRLLSIIYGRRAAKDLNEDKISIAVGRVMTCVLGMVVSREREIKNFVKTKYYRVVGNFGESDSSIQAEWKASESSKYFNSPLLYNESGFKKEEDAKKFIQMLEGKQAKVLELKKSTQKENAPLLFNLAEIQNECTKTFKIKPDETLEIIQELYEKKLVTYPRTDARVLSTAIAKEIGKNLNGIYKSFDDEEIKAYMKKMIDEKYSTNLVKTKYVNDSKITDHYAIIPTGQGYENYNSLSDLKKKVYKLITRRFIAVFYPAAEFSKVNLTLEVDKEMFYASGKVCKKQGYLEVLKNRMKNEKEDNLDILTALKKGTLINVLGYETKDSETSPPSRYNSGGMVLAMENAGKLIEDEALREQIKGAGIGTSATRGEIIKKLERIKYIDINSKTQIITPTAKGEVIYDVVNKSIPDMLNPDLTASWEKGLDMVAKKEIKSEIFMEKLEKYISSKIDKLVLR
ncbi:MAG: type IA DNA topoisomerase [Clostridia bacterium]|nr:type IA DNA topoisomerase [Clostridia bacterium]